MKQYCRYCAYCIEQIDDAVWCESLDKLLSVGTAKRENKCKSFLFCEIDALNPERKYKPLIKKNTEKLKQGELCFE